MKRYILLLVLTMMLGEPGVAIMSESTTDISYILPAYGAFTAETGRWVLDWDTSTHHSSTAFFCPTCSEPHVTLRCFADPTQTYAPAQIEAISQGYDSPSTNSFDLSTVKRQEILISITFRGSPDASYGNGTIYGMIQPIIDNAYWAFSAVPRTPGVSPGYIEAVSYKAISILNPNPKTPVYNYATFAVTTEWTTLTWRFIPIHQNFFRIGFIGVKYYADGFDTPPGPLVSTELQIKQIKLEAIRFY